jgi:adenylate cyclase
MNNEDLKRKLTAVLHADIKGYSRLMGDNEYETIRTLTAYREVITNLIQKHQGRLVDFHGDELLAEFASIVDAVCCAVEIQEEIKTRNSELPENRKMEFCIGLNLGDVVKEGERIFGDGINIAARLEDLAGGGGICISGSVYDSIKNKLDFGYECLGEQTFKNIEYPVMAYRLLFGDTASSQLMEITNLSEDHFIVPGFSERPAIAILPFDNISRDPKQDYFVDGITQDLIDLLSKQKLFPVIARNSSFAYKEKSLDVKRIGRDLGAKYLIQGSVRKAGNNIRINAELIETEKGLHIWSNKYDQMLGNIFELQDDVTLSICGAIDPELQRAELKHYAGKRPNLNSWDLFQRGQWYLNQRTKKTNEKARGCYQRASDLDPSFASAIAYKGLTYIIEANMGWSRPRSRFLELARVEINKAILLDDKDPDIHLLQGTLLSHLGQQETAIESYQYAVRLNPSLAHGYTSLGQALALSGRSEEGIQAIERGIRLSPNDPLMWDLLSDLALAYFTAEKYEEAVKSFRQSQRLRPLTPNNLSLFTAALGHLGLHDEANDALETLLREVPDITLQRVEHYSSRFSLSFSSKVVDGLRKAGLMK